MNVVFTENGWDEYVYWQETDKKMVRKIHELIKAISRGPYQGIGKPEPLKHDYTGCWSRRISGEHRFVYQIDKGQLVIYQLRYHY